jgi:Mg2+ and Co2+ transporter CorA
MSETNSKSSQKNSTWYDDVESGVRQIRSKEGTFDWFLIDLKISESILSTYIDNSEIRTMIADPFSECGRFRMDQNIVFRIEFPRELEADAPTSHFVLLINADRLIVGYTKPEPQLESSIREIAGCLHINSPMIAACEILDDTLDLLREPLMKINKDIDTIEECILDGTPSKFLDAPILLRQKLLTIDRHLDALEALLRRTILDSSSSGEKNDLASLREVTDRTAWLNQRVSNQLDRVRGISDQLRIIAMDNLNISMFRLSIIATVFLPLSFITGLLGINVGGIPGSQNAAAFWIVCSGLTGLAIITLIFLVKTLRNR